MQIEETNLKNKYFKTKPEILSQHIIPIALHEINPRTHMKSSQWTKLKKETQKTQDLICKACGRKVPHVPRDYLELHEEFLYDYEKRIATVESMVGLCRKCHEYIHQGRLRKLLSESQISEEYYNEIIERGDKILSENGLKKQEARYIDSQDWKLFWQGEELTKK